MLDFFAPYIEVVQTRFLFFSLCKLTHVVVESLLVYKLAEYIRPGVFTIRPGRDIKLGRIRSYLKNRLSHSKTVC
jgi:hypothetical protein